MTEYGTLNTIIHAAVRRDLDRFEAALGCFPADSRTRADQLMDAWNLLSDQLHLHHHDEENFFWAGVSRAGSRTVTDRGAGWRTCPAGRRARGSRSGHGYLRW